MRHTLGVAVFAGMFGVTLFGIFLTPVFYYVIMWLTGQHRARPLPEVQPAPTAARATHVGEVPAVASSTAIKSGGL
jgi:multidrug efflux pump